MIQAKTYEADDALDRKKFGDQLYGLMRSEFILTDESFVVALTGGFGSGKSHFLEMWENDIRSRADAPLVVHVNAWESDHSGEPVLAIVSAITEQMNAATSIPEKAIATMKSAAARVVRGGASLTKDILLGYVKENTGFDIGQAVEAIKEDQVKSHLNKAAASVFEQHEARKRAINDLRESLEALIKDSQELSIIIVVDELDRCRPTYAIDFLESLKHLFNVKGLAVLLAVDWEQLSCTAGALFGSGLNTNEYFRKFFTRKVALPAPGVAELKSLIEKLWTKLFTSKSLGERYRFTLAPDFRNVGPGPVRIILGLGVLRPRQVEEIFRGLSHYLFTDVEVQNAVDPGHFDVILFLLSVSSVNSTLFEQIAQGSAPVKDCLECVLGITRPRGRKIDLNLEYLEQNLIDALVDRNNVEDFKEKFRETLSASEFKKSSVQSYTMPQYSTGVPESQMQKLAIRLGALKRFSDS